MDKDNRPRGYGDWSAILERGGAIVDGYDTGVTLRQLFYRLVADGTLPNTQQAYKALSSRSAVARRAGTFPALIDQGRTIQRPLAFTGAGDARSWLASVYRRDRTEGQPVTLALGVEKATLTEQLVAWFAELGLPILATRGYGSQTYLDEVTADVEGQGRPAVLLYAGDHDPSGEDIDRDFVARTGCWAKVERVALTAEQVDTYDLPLHAGKATDSRAKAFTARHGRLVQVELEALPPETLRELFAEAIAAWWDLSAHEAVLAMEAVDAEELALGSGGGLHGPQ